MILFKIQTAHGHSEDSVQETDTDGSGDQETTGYPLSRG